MTAAGGAFLVVDDLISVLAGSPNTFRSVEVVVSIFEAAEPIRNGQVGSSTRASCGGFLRGRTTGGLSRRRSHSPGPAVSERRVIPRGWSSWRRGTDYDGTGQPTV